MTERDRTSNGPPGAEWRRTITALLSAAIVSALVWGVVVFFHVR
jgi:hypothetical protein